MQRYGSIIGLRTEKLGECKQLHAAVWPDVLEMIKRCNIRNYSIYLRKLPDGKHCLFSYWLGVAAQKGHEDQPEE